MIVLDVHGDTSSRSGMIAVFEEILYYEKK